MTKHTIQYLDNYSKYGLSYAGRVAVIAYRVSPQSEFGSQDGLDALDSAREQMAQEHPGATVLIDIPELVVKL